ncbi:MAG: hypothetical protein EPGJADBJ_02705 [Saprospiraceae bacterium]|nr:hypothetical protein [Saprospiraceae bacterium]
MIGAFHHDTETFARTGAIVLNITAHCIAGDGYAGGNINVARSPAPAERGNTYQIALFRGTGGDKTTCKGYDITVHRDIRAVAIGIFDLNTKTAVVRHCVICNSIRSYTSIQPYQTDTIVPVVVYVVVADVYIRSRAVLQFDTAAVVVINIAVRDRDVLFQAVPDDNAAGGAKGCSVSRYV